jgi:iron complex transport system ATP-binding protein
MLSVRGLAAGYGATRVIEDVDLDAAPGELLAIIGPNGCGKTTLLRAITGVLRPQAGTITIGGDAIEGMSAQAVARRVAVVAQAGAVPEGFSAFEVALMGRAPHLRLLQSEGSGDRAILAVTHDRYFIDRLADRLLLVEDGRLREGRLD